MIWKIKMSRQIKSIESSFEYELPMDLCSMLDSINMVDEAYHDSIYDEVFNKLHASSGFFPECLVKQD